MTDASVVTLQVWRVPTRTVPLALARARATARRLRHCPAVSFAKVLGTASDDFVPTAATPRRWALLTRSHGAVDTRATSWWTDHADESATLTLRPLRSTGAWDGTQPFSAPPTTWSGPVLALTRSKVRTSKAIRFYAAVPAVAAELRAAAGCLVAFGIGEAPLLRQGTVSIWSSESAMRAFAYAAPTHVRAVRATPAMRWYAEDLFARFAIVDAAGTIDGVGVA